MCHGNSAPCGSVGSGDMALVSSFMYLGDDLRQVHQESARGVVSEDRKVRREELRVVHLRCGAEDGL